MVRLDGMWSDARVLVLIALSLSAAPYSAAKKLNITIGYLPCLIGELRDRQGLLISGALSLALEEINNSSDLLPELDLQLEWHDSKCDTELTKRLVTDMSNRDVVAFFGPEVPHCRSEALIAEAKNLPMISYKCADQTSKLSNFVLLEPPATAPIKALISLLRYYRWNKFSIVYEESWTNAALNLEKHAKMNNMTINQKSYIIDGFTCCEDKLDCCKPGFWYRYVKNTKDQTRIYVLLGSISSLIDMMTAMEDQHLFSHGEYMVLFVDMHAYTPDTALKYLIRVEDRRFVCPNSVEFRKRAQSLLVVSNSEPLNDYEAFANKVRRYNALEPFHFPDPFGRKFVSIYAAYLYDSVKLYAKALDAIIREDTTPGDLEYSKLMSIVTNGSRIVKKMIENTPFQSISGRSIRLNENGESEGDFSVLAFKTTMKHDVELNCSYNMIPVGQFQQSSRQYPEYKLNPRLPIDWADSIKPEDEPAEGFIATSSRLTRSSTWRSLPSSCLHYLIYLFALSRIFM